MANDENFTSVVIMTNNYRITGKIGLVPGARLTDYITEKTHFFPVVEARVADRISHKVLFRCEFLDVNRENVEIIVPADKMRDL